MAHPPQFTDDLQLCLLEYVHCSLYKYLKYKQKKWNCKLMSSLNLHIMETERRAPVRPTSVIFEQQEPWREPQLHLRWSWAFCAIFLWKLDHRWWRWRMAGGALKFPLQYMYYLSIVLIKYFPFEIWKLSLKNNLEYVHCTTCRY